MKGEARSTVSGEEREGCGDSRWKGGREMVVRREKMMGERGEIRVRKAGLGSLRERAPVIRPSV